MRGTATTCLEMAAHDCSSLTVARTCLSQTSWPSFLKLSSKAPMYYRNANCAVVVYDITQSASLEKARSWVRELQRQADPSIVIALCGNKTDLNARRQVSQEEAKKYADEEGLMWGETSAKTGEGVSDIFTAIGQSPFEYLRFAVNADRRDSQEAALVYPTIQARCQPWIRPWRAGRRPQQESCHHRANRRL